jgi:hypothetical protein
LVPPQSIYEVGWDTADVGVDLSRDEIRRSPAYEPGRPVPSAYIDRLATVRPERRSAEP